VVFEYYAKVKFIDRDEFDKQLLHNPEFDQLCNNFQNMRQKNLIFMGDTDNDGVEHYLYREEEKHLIYKCFSEYAIISEEKYTGDLPIPFHRRVYRFTTPWEAN